MNFAPIDVPRLLRLAALLLSGAAGCLIYFAYEPQIDVEQMHLADAQTKLLSQDIAFSALPRLRLERSALERRFDTPFFKSPEAAFIRELASTVHRDAVSLISTSVTQSDGVEADPSRPELWKQTKVILEVRGTYRRLLQTVRDLSHGSSIVGVESPTLRRDGNALLATIPLTIYEPAAARSRAAPLRSAP